MSEWEREKLQGGEEKIKSKKIANIWKQ